MITIFSCLASASTLKLRHFSQLSLTLGYSVFLMPLTLLPLMSFRLPFTISFFNIRASCYSRRFFHRCYRLYLDSSVSRLCRCLLSKGLSCRNNLLMGRNYQFLCCFVQNADNPEHMSRLSECSRLPIQPRQLTQTTRERRLSVPVFSFCSPPFFERIIPPYRRNPYERNYSLV